MSTGEKASTSKNQDMSPEMVAHMEAMSRRVMGEVEAMVRTAAEQAGSTGAERVLNESKDRLKKEAEDAFKEAAEKSKKTVEGAERLERGSRTAFFVTGTLFMLGSAVAAGMNWNKNRKSGAMPEATTPAKAR